MGQETPWFGQFIERFQLRPVNIGGRNLAGGRLQEVGLNRQPLLRI